MRAERSRNVFFLSPSSLRPTFRTRGRQPDIEDRVTRTGVGYRDTGHRLTHWPGGFPMHVRCLVTTISVLAVTTLVPASVAGQTRKWTPPRTADGKPDIQGTFTFSTITPLQRPEALADKDVLTAEEAAAFEAAENERQNRDLFDPEK